MKEEEDDEGANEIDKGDEMDEEEGEVNIEEMAKEVVEEEM